MAIYTDNSTWTRRALKAGILTAIALAAGTSVNAGNTPTWRPAPADISKMEPNLSLPEHAYDLNSYARYYSGIIVSGHHVIEGYFIKGLGKRPGVYLNQLHDDIADGGCSIVTIYYDADKRRMAGAACNGYA
jgi:hypothetical protein